jgi:hypothetical protein
VLGVFAKNQCSLSASVVLRNDINGTMLPPVMAPAFQPKHIDEVAKITNRPFVHAGPIDQVDATFQATTQRMR